MSRTLSVKDAMPDLVTHWLCHYRAALDEGLGALPSGNLTDDPHCAAAAYLARQGNRAVNWPVVYGGRGSLFTKRNRWSAMRKAALRTFEKGIELGLSPRQATWAVRNVESRGKLLLTEDERQR